MSTKLSGSNFVDSSSENVVNDNMAERNNSRSDSEKSEQQLDNHDAVDESEKECLTLESRDSETETSTTEDGGYERFMENRSTGCGDRLTEAIHDESSRFKAHIRHRGHQEDQREMAMLESNKQDLIPIELSIINDGYTDMLKESTSDGVIPDRQITATEDNTTSFPSLWDWFIYFASRVICIIFLSFIYLGFAILSIKVLHFFCM